MLICKLVSHLHLHLIALHIDKRGVDEGVHVLSLSYKGLGSDLLVREVVWHSGLTVGHVDLESSVSCMSVENQFSFFWMHVGFHRLFLTLCL